jgi:hypothetical protein
MAEQPVCGPDASIAIIQDSQTEDRAAMSPSHAPPANSSNLQETSHRIVTSFARTGNLKHEEGGNKIASQVGREESCQTELQEEGLSMKVCR